MSLSNIPPGYRDPADGDKPFGIPSAKRKYRERKRKEELEWRRKRWDPSKLKRYDN